MILHRKSNFNIKASISTTEIMHVLWSHWGDLKRVQGWDKYVLVQITAFGGQILTLVQMEPFGTLREPASSPPAVFRMIAPGSSEEPISLAETQAELKASGSIPGNLWYSEETLVRDNTGAGMLAQIVNCAGISLQLISAAQDPAKNICFVKILQALRGISGVYTSARYSAVGSSVSTAPSCHVAYLCELLRDC